jgi:AraC-like DNA-binding protein
MAPRAFYLDQEWTGGRAVEIEWLASLVPVFAAKESVTHGTQGTQSLWTSKKFVLSHSICERANLVSRPLLLADSRVLDHLGFVLVLDGAVEVECGNVPTRAETGDFVLLDLREPIRLVLGEQERATSVFTLWVPRARLPAQLSGQFTLHGLVAKACAPGIAVAAAALRALMSQLDAITVNEMDELLTGVVGLIGHAIRLYEAPQVSNANSPAPLDTFVTLCRYIESNLAARDLGVVKLAATFGLSRASLYRLFEPVGGVASFIRERRLARAHQVLTAPGLQNRRIGPIAYQAGFRSLAAFNRSFLAAYGDTPRNVRKQKAARASR